MSLIFLYLTANFNRPTIKERGMYIEKLELISNPKHMPINDTKIYPAIPIKQGIIFPGERMPLFVEGKEMIASAQRAFETDGLLVLSFEINGQMRKFATVARVMQIWYVKPEVLGMLVEGIRRVKVDKIFVDDHILKTKVTELLQKKYSDLELEALARNIFERCKKIINLNGLIPFTVAHLMPSHRPSAESTPDLVAAALDLKLDDKVAVFEILDNKERLKFVSEQLAQELNIVQTEKKIEKSVEKEIDKMQKEYILRERLKAIEKELGITEDQDDVHDLEKKIRQAKMPHQIELKALKELSRLKAMTAASAETPYIRTYLDTIVELPWSVESKDIVDIKRAKKILDEDHYGLEKVKERVLEYLSVQKLTDGKIHGSILCLVGPPGTGKTSIGQSIANALGRKLIRISLGGIHDEAEIRGHRRTYVGAMPGRVIQGMKNAGTKNPVFMMDEIDKIGSDFRGDPASALLEVLDPEQNNTFSDNYLEVPFDLSRVFFITTANIADSIPPALRDRLEFIEFPGYFEEEKVQIANQHLIPKVLHMNGLENDTIRFEKQTLINIISHYTAEAGVRNLERRISEVVRKIARKVAEENGKNKKYLISAKDLLDYLGPPNFESTKKNKMNEVGVATALAWTPAGGEIMFVEATLMPGKGNLTITGQLGSIMQESIKASVSYIRSHAKELNIPEDFYYKNDIHIHVPSGAIPKDGPSAGVVMVTALTSALTKRKVKKDIAMSGEITLVGKVLKIGGVKEKVLAAHRSGIQNIILPYDNQNDMTEIDEEVRKKLHVHFVKNVNEIFKLLLI